MKLRPANQVSHSEQMLSLFASEQMFQTMRTVAERSIGRVAFEKMSVEAQRAALVTLGVQALLQAKAHPPGTQTDTLLRAVGTAMAGVTASWPPIKRKEAVDLVLLGLSEGLNQ